MYHDLLKRVLEKMKDSGEVPQPPCASQQLEALRRRATNELGQTIPQGYSAFLSESNGFFWNGLIVYASQRTPLMGCEGSFLAGFVDENLDYRDVEELKDYLIFADDGTVFYTYHIGADSFEVILRVGLTVLQSFNSFEELMADAFTAIGGE